MCTMKLVCFEISRARKIMQFTPNLLLIWMCVLFILRTKCLLKKNAICVFTCFLIHYIVLLSWVYVKIFVLMLVFFWIVCMHKQRKKSGNPLKCAAWHFRRLCKKLFGWELQSNTKFRSFPENSFGTQLNKRWGCNESKLKW